MPIVQVKISSRIFKVDPVAGDPYVMVEIEVECPECGPFTLQLAGHHLRTIRDVCIEAIDQYPELTKIESQIVDRFELKRKVGGDPSSN